MTAAAPVQISNEWWTLTADSISGLLTSATEVRGGTVFPLSQSFYYYTPYQDNARRWYKEAQENVFFMNHTLVNPPVDRNKGRIVSKV